MWLIAQSCVTCVLICNFTLSINGMEKYTRNYQIGCSSNSLIYYTPTKYEDLYHYNTLNSAEPHRAEESANKTRYKLYRIQLLSNLIAIQYRSCENWAVIFTYTEVYLNVRLNSVDIILNCWGSTSLNLIAPVFISTSIIIYCSWQVNKNGCEQALFSIIW